MRKRLFAALFSALSVVQASAEVSLVARLELTPTHTLPGIPVMFSVTVTNPNSVPKTLYQKAQVTVTPAQGETFTIGSSADSLVSLVKPLSNTMATIIPAGASVTLFVPVGPELLRNSVFYDDRLSAPGTYDLRMTIGTENLTTNAARLTVDTPTGDDLAVWKAATANGARLSVMSWLATDAVKKYPASTYYRLLALYTAPSEKPEDVIQVLQNALAAGVPQPLNDEFAVQVAYDYGMVARTAASNGDFSAADSALRSANAALKPVLDHPANALTSAEALTTADDMNAIAAAVRDKKSKKSADLWRPLTPFVQCRTNAGLIQFGYTNSNQVQARIAIGSTNRFDPEPADRGQMTEFKEGTHRKAALVPLLSGEQTLKWMLDGSSAVFSASEKPKICDQSDNDN